MDLDLDISLPDGLFSDGEIEQIPFADQEQISGLIIPIGQIRNPSTNLHELAGNSAVLKSIASTLDRLFHEKGSIQYTLEARREVYAAICAFASEAARIKAEEVKASIPEPRVVIKETDGSAELLERTQEMLVKSEKSYNDLSKALNEANKQNDELEAKLRETQSDLDTLRGEHAEFLKRFVSFKGLHDESVRKMKSETDAAEEKTRLVSDKLKQSEFTIERLKTQNNELNSELSAVNSEIVEVRGKLMSKSIKLDEVKDELRKYKLKIRELETQFEQMKQSTTQMRQDYEKSVRDIQTSVSSVEPTSTFEASNNNLSLSELVKLLKQQSEDNTDLNSIKDSLTRVVNNQSALISEYDAALSKCMEELRSAQMQERAAQQMVDSMKEHVTDYDDLAQLHERTNTKLMELENSIRSVLSNFVDEEIDDIPEVLASVLNKYADGAGQEQNRRLVELLENNIRFITDTANTGILQTSHLTPYSTSTPLAKDKGILNQLAMQIARSEQFISQNKLGAAQESSTSPQEFINFVSKRLSNCNSTLQREILAFLSVHITNSTVIASHCEKLQEQIRQTNSYMADISKIINVSGNVSEVARQAAHELDCYHRIGAIVSDITNNEEYDMFESISSYIEQADSFLSFFDSEFREAIGFEGPLEGLPMYILPYINGLVSKYEEEYDNTMQELKEELSRIKFETTEENEKATAFIAELERLLEEKTKTAEDLSNEYQEALKKAETESQRAQEMENKCNSMETKFKEISAAMSQLSNDNDVLRRDIAMFKEENEKKNRRTEEQIDLLLQNERKLHAEDIEAVEKRFKIKEEALQRQLQQKNTKISQLKAKLKEIINGYETAFTQQKEATSSLRRQNEALTSNLNELRSEIFSKQSSEDQEKDRLRQIIKSLEMEKHILQKKCGESKNLVEAAKSARDEYWKSVLLVKEAALFKEAEERVAALQQKYSALQRDISSAIGMFIPDLNDKSLVDSVKSLTEKISSLQAQIKKSNVSTPTKPDVSLLSSSSINRSSKALEEWNRWARDLLMSFNNTHILGCSQRELRFLIGEMVVASIGHRSLISKLDSLRFQKKLLLSSYGLPAYQPSTIQFGSLVFVSVFVTRIAKNRIRNVLHDHGFQTPTKQTLSSML